jgi:hypothetical protein
MPMPASAFVVIGNGWLEYWICPFWKVVGSGIERIVVTIVAVLEEERHDLLLYAQPLPICNQIICENACQYWYKYSIR